MSSTVIFGDVHGNATALQKMFEKFGDTDVTYYTLGDLIDRGPDSKRVLELCAEHNVNGVYGNHELWLLNVLNGFDVDDMAYDGIMGGKATLKSYGVSIDIDTELAAGILRNKLSPAVVAFVNRLKPTMTIEAYGTKYYLNHSGINTMVVKQLVDQLRPSIGFMPNYLYTDDQLLLSVIEKSCINQIIWMSPDIDSRAGGLHKFADGVQVFGHKPLKEAKVTDHYIGLDTGSGTCPPYKLSALVITETGRKIDVF